jgi:hypothetical protein
VFRSKKKRVYEEAKMILHLLYHIQSIERGRRMSLHFNCVSQETLNETIKKVLDEALMKQREQLTTEFTNILKSYFANAQSEIVVVPSIIPPQESPRPSTDQVSSNKICA